MSDFNELKTLYEDGYRCIYQNNKDNNHTIYLKNFYDDYSKALEVNINDENEFNKFQNYINDLNLS